jgi:WD40 repeat protein
MNPNSTPENSSQIESTNTIADENGNSGSGFADNAKEEEKASLHLGAGQNENKKLVLPTLTVKNSAGQVKSLQMSANKQYLSLLLEDGSVRIWDLLRGVQRQILASDPTQSSIDITAVDDEGELLSIASKAKVGVYDVISATVDTTVKEANIKCFVSSNDGRLLLMSSTADKLFLWDREQNDKLWKTTYQRGKVMSLALTNDKRYGAVLSNQQGSYLLPANLRLKPVTDAIDIIDLENGKVLKSLPNIGEQVVSMQFKNNDTLQIALENGEVLNWSVQNGTQKIVAAFAEQVTAVDAIGDRYSYVLKDGTVRVGDGQGHVQLSIKNKDNPLKNAKLIDEGKKLLTVMASGDLALWDVGTGKKMLRLFSLQQGWTVMDAFGRFDGSEEALGNFSWLANEEDIPLDSFSENYYEPGLLASVLQNQDHLNNNSAVKNGITLPPKVELQLAEQQTGDDVSLQMDIYNRGGGIDKIKIYHNGRLLSDGSMTEIQASSEQKETEHRIFTLKVTPSAGKNTLKVIASNTMGIENSSSELSFDGKTKAYDSYLRVLTVGIDRYSDPQLNLDYSVADASLIGDAIKNNAKVSVSKSLYNENATKPKILAELKELSQGAQQDVLVIYFAGHGLAVGKEWYFLPYETKMQSTMEKIAQTGITATELGDIFKNSKIQHILLMVDSCYSGAGMDVFSKLENGQRYFTRQLSRSLGITVLTATAKDQEAAELKSLGHGLFTYLMGQQLQQTDSGSPVTAHGIAKSIVKALPIFSKRILGFSQEPVAYTHGSDFILSDELKSTIKNGTLKNTLPINRTKKESDQ